MVNYSQLGVPLSRVIYACSNVALLGFVGSVYTGEVLRLYIFVVAVYGVLKTLVVEPFRKCSYLWGAEWFSRFELFFFGSALLFFLIALFSFSFFLAV